MSRKLLTVVLGSLLLAGSPAAAQPGDEAAGEEPAAQEPPPEYAPPSPEEAGTPPPIPPHVEGVAVTAPSGGYCYGGPHPVDTRYSPGATWDPQPGKHIRPYPPIDLRLFAYKDGCYYFIGDPRDFGYTGETHLYYGAHPILPEHGGGWCFMIGPHSHFWRPWSPQFVVVGPWYYWEGPYDPVFWAYWPYYSFYYREYYPHYYRGGHFYHRHRGHRVAPRIDRVPPPRVAGQSWRGRPAGGGVPPAARGGAPSSPAPRAGAPRGSSTWRGSPGGSSDFAAPRPPARSTRPAPAPDQTAAPAAPPGGGWRRGPGASSAGSGGGSGVRGGAWGASPSRSPSPGSGRSSGGGGRRGR